MKQTGMLFFLLWLHFQLRSPNSAGFAVVLLLLPLIWNKELIICNFCFQNNKLNSLSECILTGIIALRGFCFYSLYEHYLMVAKASYWYKSKTLTDSALGHTLLTYFAVSMTSVYFSDFTITHNCSLKPQWPLGIKLAGQTIIKHGHLCKGSWEFVFGKCRSE